MFIFKLNRINYVFLIQQHNDDCDDDDASQSTSCCSFSPCFASFFLFFVFQFSTSENNKRKVFEITNSTNISTNCNKAKPNALTHFYTLVLVQ